MPTGICTHCRPAYPEKCFNVGALVRRLGNFVHQDGGAARTRGFIRRGPGSPHGIEVLVSPEQLPVLESKTNQTKPPYRGTGTKLRGNNV